VYELLRRLQGSPTIIEWLRELAVGFTDLDDVATVPDDWWRLVDACAHHFPDTFAEPFFEEFRDGVTAELNGIGLVLRGSERAFARMLLRRFAADCGRAFCDWLVAERSVYEVRQGDVFPLPRPFDLHKLISASRFTRGNHRRPEAQMPNLSVLDDPATVRFHFDGPDLATEDVAGFWGATLNERLEGELTIDDPGTERFFGVRPIDTTRQAERVRRVFQRAREVRAILVVLPELCLEESLEQLVHAEFDASPSLRFLIAGSSHVTHPHRANRTTVLQKGTNPTFHFKFNPVVVGGKEEGFVDRHIRLNLYWSEHPFTVAICKDALEPHAGNVLRALRARFLFIPSLTEEVQEFEQVLGGISAEAQTIAVLCHFPVSNTGERARLTVVRPVRDDSVVRVLLQVAELTRIPGLT